MNRIAPPVLAALLILGCDRSLPEPHDPEEAYREWIAGTELVLRRAPLFGFVIRSWTIRQGDIVELNRRYVRRVSQGRYAAYVTVKLVRDGRALEADLIVRYGDDSNDVSKLRKIDVTPERIQPLAGF